MRRTQEQDDETAALRPRGGVVGTAGREQADRAQAGREQAGREQVGREDSPADEVLRMQAAAGNQAVADVLANPGGGPARPALTVVQRMWEARARASHFENETGEQYDSGAKKHTDATYRSKVLSSVEHAELMRRIDADLAGQGAADDAAADQAGGDQAGGDQAGGDQAGGDQQPAGGGHIDFAAVRATLQTYDAGKEAIAPAEWRRMRAELSVAVTLPNKSHPAHGSNFNKKQRAVEQVKDWATPLPPALMDALRPVLNAQFGANTF